MPRLYRQRFLFANRNILTKNRKLCTKAGVILSYITKMYPKKYKTNLLFHVLSSIHSFFHQKSDQKANGLSYITRASLWRSFYYIMSSISALFLFLQIFPHFSGQTSATACHTWLSATPMLELHLFKYNSKFTTNTKKRKSKIFQPFQRACGRCEQAEEAYPNWPQSGSLNRRLPVSWAGSQPLSWQDIDTACVRIWKSVSPEG